MENQLLKWEKSLQERRIRELESSVKHASVAGDAAIGRAVDEDCKRVRADSEVEFKLPSRDLMGVGDMSSGYTSMEARVHAGDQDDDARPSGRSSGLRLSDWTTPHRSDRESTPMPHRVPQSDANQNVSGTNPFLGAGKGAGLKQAHCDLLSFATRSPSKGKDGHVEVSDEAIVGPWKLERGERFVDEGNRVHTAQMINQRPNIVPDRYSGKVPWSEYQGHFESCQLVNRWDEEQSAEYLAASLQGDALRVLANGNLRGRKHTYQELVALLSRRFGQSRLAESFLVELRHRRQRPRESLQEVAQSVHELAAKAYPDILEESLDRLEVNHFMDAIANPSVRQGIFRARPKTLSDAVQAALETESFEEVEAQRRMEKGSKFARVLDRDTEQRFQQLEKAVGDHSQSFGEVTKQLACIKDLLASLQTKEVPSRKAQDAEGESKTLTGKRPKSELRCFNCEKKGHFAWECKEPKRKVSRRQGNGNQPTEGSTERLDQGKDPKV